MNSMIMFTDYHQVSYQNQCKQKYFHLHFFLVSLQKYCCSHAHDDQYKWTFIKLTFNELFPYCVCVIFCLVINHFTKLIIDFWRKTIFNLIAKSWVIRIDLLSIKKKTNEMFSPKKRLREKLDIWNFAYHLDSERLLICLYFSMHNFKRV